jgi:hypothetical protein
MAQNLMWPDPNLKICLATKLGSAHYGNQPKTEMAARSITNVMQQATAKNWASEKIRKHQKYRVPLIMIERSPAMIG